MLLPSSKDTQNIVVTGGAGFIGSNFVEMLLSIDEDSTIYVVDSLVEGSNLANLDAVRANSRFEFIESDIKNANNFLPKFKPISQIYNFAAQSHVDRSITGPTSFVESNVTSFFELLEVARLETNARFVQISTDEVYGSREATAACEDDLPSPSSIYSATKMSAEMIALANYKTHSQDVVISRSCNNFGPRQNREKLIPMLIHSAMMNVNLPIYGSGKQIREWIYVEENNKAIWKIAKHAKPGNVYNVGSGVRLSNLEIAKKILDYFPASTSKIEHVKDRKGHDFRYALDSSKLSNELSWTSSQDFDSHFKSTVSWYRERAKP